MTASTTLPDNDWTLDQLGEFCIESYKKMAADVWTIGRAMCIAKTKCQDEGKSFTEWKQRHKFSIATTNRYMRLFLAFPTEHDRERLATIGIMEALVQAGVSKPKNVNFKRDGLATQDATRSGHTVADTVPALIPIAKTPSWAVTKEGDSKEPPKYSDETVELWSYGQTLMDECRQHLPWQLRTLGEKTEALLSAGEEALHEAWPATDSERQQIIDDIDHLMHILPQLVATVPRKQRAELKMAI